MRQEIMEHYRLLREFDNAGFYESEEHRHILEAIEQGAGQGKIMVLSGIVGCGKTTTLNRSRESLTAAKKVLVVTSLSADKGRVSLSTLFLSMFYELATEKDFRIPIQPERREYALRELFRKHNLPVALFIDEAHNLRRDTLNEIKHLIEIVRMGGGILSVVLAGKPKLKNDLRRPVMEETGDRAIIFSMDTAHGANREYIYWILRQCAKPGTEPHTLFDEEAVDILAERLATPLQIGHHLTLAIEAAFHIGGQPVSKEIAESVLAKDINDMEPKLVRHGYGTKVLAELLNTNTGEVRKLVRGQLPPGRARELHAQMLKAGVPL